VRGYQAEHARIPRNVQLAFSGFKSTDIPPNGDSLAQRGRLVCGRNSRTTGSGATDVCLRAYNTSTGEYDEPATMALSRRHFDVIVANDRMYVQALAASGIEVNGEALATNGLAEIKTGDKLVPIPGHPEKLTLQLAFAKSRSSIDRITLSRTPAVK
jgi:hypothetical protein